MKHVHYQAFSFLHYDDFRKFSQFNPDFCHRFMVAVVESLVSHIVSFVMFELQRTRLLCLLSSPGHTLSLENCGAPAACWVQSLWMSACLTEGVTLYPTKYYVKA